MTKIKLSYGMITWLPMMVALLLLYGRFSMEESNVPPLPRGDVAIDAAVAQSLIEGQGFWTPWERGSHYRPPAAHEAFGHPADQHPPLWPLVGAGLIWFWHLDPIHAMELASFTAHMVALLAMVWLAFRLGLGRLAFLPGLAYAVTSTGSAFSYNGSLYAGQAALYLLAAGLIARKRPSLVAAGFLGVILGAAYLLNYQALLLVPAWLIAHLLIHGKAGFSGKNLACLCLTLLVFAAVLSPWLLRNQALFDSPTYSVNQYYVLAKAGATFSHQQVGEHLIFTLDPISLPVLAKGLARCAWQNIPFFLLLLMALFPGCLALLACRRPSFKPESRCPLVCALLVILVCHLGVSFLWPALKLRYLVPAGPILLLLACKRLLPLPEVHRRWTLGWAALLGLGSVAIWLKGSLHGERLLLAFLLGYGSLTLLLFLPRSTVFLRRLPALGLALLVLASAGTLPGTAYFNLPTCPDFFGEDKDRLELRQSEELVQAVHILRQEGIREVLADLRLWHANPALQVTTPPQQVPGKTWLESLRLAGPETALLPLSQYLETPELQDLNKRWQGREWVLVDLF